MGIFETLNKVAGTASGLLGLGSGAVNLFQDLNNTDVARQQAANAALMNQQHVLNLESMAKQYEYNKQIQALQHDYNLETMDKQFAMNDFLSSAARDVFNQRSAGLNPAERVATGVNSVGSIPASAPVGSALGVQSGSVSAVSPNAQFGNTFSELIQSDASLIKSKASSNRDLAEAHNINIDSQTKLQRDIMDLYKQKSEIYKNLASGKLSEAEADHARKDLERIDKDIERMQTEIETMNRNATSREREVDIMKQNADTKVKEQEEEVRHNKASEAIGRMANSIQQQNTNINAQLITPTVSKLYAEADYLTSHQRLNQEELKYRAKQLLASLNLTEAEAKKVKTQAEYEEWRQRIELLELAMRAYKEFGEGNEANIKALQEIVNLAKSSVPVVSSFSR